MCDVLPYFYEHTDDHNIIDESHINFILENIKNLASNMANNLKFSYASMLDIWKKKNYWLSAHEKSAIYSFIPEYI